jgi:formylglycine-generating enzyme required for sulfatase activity
VAQGGCSPAVAGTGVMVKVGPFCIDKYEASVWSSPTGGTQYGVSSDDYPCSDSGQDCTNIYARSVAGVKPSRFITWFQALQALANSGKRLPTNAEWQTAAVGTPNAPSGPSACADSTDAPDTGSNASCVSTYGVHDMAGNPAEWVADWVAQASTCGGSWNGSGFGSDEVCLGGGTSSGVPAALIRGGGSLIGNDSPTIGPFAVDGRTRADASTYGSFPWSAGFRGAR